MTWFLRQNVPLVIVLGIILWYQNFVFSILFTLIIFILGWSFVYWQYILGQTKYTNWFAVNIKWLVTIRSNFRQYGMYMFVQFERLKSKVRLKVYMECTQNNRALTWCICKIIVWSTFALFLKNLLIRQYYVLSCMFKIMKEMAPNYLKNLIPISQSVRTRTNRVPTFHCGTNCFKNSFFPSTLSDWFKLDVTISISGSIAIFKSRLVSFVRPVQGNVYIWFYRIEASDPFALRF